MVMFYAFREAWNNELGSILQLWKKLNQGTNSVIHLKIDVPRVRNDMPILQFIQLERYNAIQIVQKVHYSLSALSKVMRGKTIH